jgi:hypothetical protein
MYIAHVPDRHRILERGRGTEPTRNREQNQDNTQEALA